MCCIGLCFSCFCSFWQLWIACITLLACGSLVLQRMYSYITLSDSAFIGRNQYTYVLADCISLLRWVGRSDALLFLYYIGNSRCKVYFRDSWFVWGKPFCVSEIGLLLGLLHSRTTFPYLSSVCIMFFGLVWFIFTTILWCSLVS